MDLELARQENEAGSRRSFQVKGTTYGRGQNVETTLHVREAVGGSGRLECGLSGAR